MNKKQTIKIIVLLVLIMFMGCIIVNYFHAGRESAKNMQCHGNLSQLSSALTHYYQQHQTIPPVTVYDNDHVALHSWRIVLAQNSLERDLHGYNFNEKWNSTNNTQITKLFINENFGIKNFFQCPLLNHENITTNYVAVTTKSGEWYTSLCDDNFSGEILLIICDRQSKIKITEPKDITLTDTWKIFKREIKKDIWEFHHTKHLGIFANISKQNITTIICREYTEDDLQLLQYLDKNFATNLKAQN
jgi:hypothetical protein